MVGVGCDVALDDEARHQRAEGAVEDGAQEEPGGADVALRVKDDDVGRELVKVPHGYSGAGDVMAVDGGVRGGVGEALYECVGGADDEQLDGVWR